MGRSFSFIIFIIIIIHSLELENEKAYHYYVTSSNKLCQKKFDVIDKMKRTSKTLYKQYSQTHCNQNISVSYIMFV